MKDLGPLLLAWGASLAVLFLEKDLGASLLFFGVFVVMLWVASGRSGVPACVGLVLFAVGAWVGYLAFSHVQLRVDYWLHALDPGKVYGLGYGQLAQGWFALASRRPGRAPGLGPGLADADPVRRRPTSSSRRSARSSGCSGTAAVLLLYLVLIGRGLRIGIERTDAFGKLLATGLTTIVARPDVRDRRRRDPADPADRRHAAVRVVRRVEPGRELRDPRRC